MFDHIPSALSMLSHLTTCPCQRTIAPTRKYFRICLEKSFSSFQFYIQVKGKWRGSKLARHVAQFSALLGAWYVGLSRVVEHKHHWSDVAVGFAVGGIYGALVVGTFKYFYLTKFLSTIIALCTRPPLKDLFTPTAVCPAHCQLQLEPRNSLGRNS